MIRIYYACSTLLILSQLVACGHYTRSVQSPRLFDGVSLSGWESLGEANWHVSEGAITADGEGSGFLVSTASHASYTLSLEFWIDASTNSGVFVACMDKQNINPDTCFEANIWDNHPNQDARTGAIVKKFMPPLAQVQSVGKWNTYEITVTESSVICRVNGVLTAQLDQQENAAGFIALQHAEQGEVRFRKIRLARN